MNDTCIAPIYYDLSIVRGYVSNWGVPEAVRELLQNALDNPEGLEIHTSFSGLIMHNPNTSLPKSSLLLGATSKANESDTIGKFGEGYKLALLVLLRNGITVGIRNNGVRWNPAFRYSDQFESEILTIMEYPDEEFAGQGVMVVVDGLSTEDRNVIVQNSLCLQEQGYETIPTSYGDILPKQPGRIYVDGLFICEEKLQFGYNIKPEFIKVERDRQTISDFNLKCQLATMWFEQDPDKVALLMKHNALDLEYAQYMIVPDKIKDACYRLFQEDHPGAFSANTQEEADRLGKASGNAIKVYGGSYGYCLRGSASYPKLQITIPLSAQDQLKAFYEDHEATMRPETCEDFENLIAVSKDWKVS